MSSLLQQQLDSYLQRNLAARQQLIGTEYMPDLAPPTTRTVGPKGIGENLANFFGLYDPTPKLEALLKERESNAALYSKAIKNLEKATLAESKAEADAKAQEVRRQKALEDETVLKRDKALLESQYAGLSDLQKQAANLSLNQSLQQTAALFPIQALAGQIATERALGASQQFAAFKEQLPSNIQAIMASKQGQLTSASDAFAREAEAIAAQQQAATGFAGLGTGRRFG